MHRGNSAKLFVHIHCMEQRLVEARLEFICDDKDPIFVLLERLADVFGIFRVHRLFGVGSGDSFDCDFA